MSSPSVTFLTRYYPPNPNINGESVCDMVEYLKNEHGVESNVICTDRDFEGGGQKRKPAGNVIRIKTLFQRDSAFFRFFTFLYDGFALVRASLKYKDTLIVVTTSPPLLPFWASIMYSKKVKWALWTLDLFPEGFAATNKISKSNPFYKWVKRKTYANKPDFLIALGPKQHEHLEHEYNSKLPASILPCGVFFYQDKSKEEPEWLDKNYLHFGYCGNIGDAHNGEFLKSVINNIDASKHRIVLALYGNQAPVLKKFAQDKPGVILVDSVPRNQLHFIDIHLVTLKTSWTHVAVPSKAVSAVSMGAAILFCGSEDSDNWHMFKENGWLIDEAKDFDKQLSSLMPNLVKEEIDQKRSTTQERYEYLKQCVLDSYNDVANFVKK